MAGRWIERIGRGVEKIGRLVEYANRHPVMTISAIIGTMAICYFLPTLPIQDSFERRRAKELAQYVGSADGKPGISTADISDFAKRAGLDSASVVKDTSGDFTNYFQEPSLFEISPGAKALISYRLDDPQHSVRAPCPQAYYPK